MTALNPIYGFIGRSSNATAMALSATYTGLAGVVQAALALGNEDPTPAHMERYTEALQRRYAGLPTDEQWAFYDEKLYVKSDNGIAFIPVWGMLFNKCGWACAYFTGYDYLRDAYSAALADSSVNAIVFDVDSFGGEVQGCMELTSWMADQRSAKPTLALANANACSAGYAIASAAEGISAIESSYVGSVGVVLVHVDYSGFLEKNGIKVSLLYEGEHKVDGNPYQPLPESVRKEWQAELVKIRERFAGQVASNRSMTVEAVLATEARVYNGPDALAVGFIDAVESPMAAVVAFSNELSGSSTQEYAMTTPQKPGAQAATDNAKTTDTTTTTTEAPPKEQASTTTTPAPAATTTAAQPSASDERARIKAIQGCDEAKGREQLASHLAFETAMSVDDAKKLLAASPKAAASDTPANPFAAAMNATPNPNVGADGSNSGDGAESTGDKTAALLRDYGAASGRVFK